MFTLIPGYNGPSPAAKVMARNGITFVWDVYANAASFGIDMILGEKNVDGSWSYIGQDRSRGLLYSLLCAASPIYTAVQQFEYPGGPAIAGTPSTIVAQEGAAGMANNWEPLIETTIQWRLTQVASDFRTPSEVAAEQTIALAIYNAPAI